MYLSLLTPELKNDFLDLALILTSADGVITDEEKTMIIEYCNEMNISLNNDVPPLPLNQLLDDISEKSDKRQKKIILFELTGLALSDSDYDISEKKIIELAAVYFDLDSSFLKSCEDVIKKYNILQNKINDIVII